MNKNEIRRRVKPFWLVMLLLTVIVCSAYIGSGLSETLAYISVLLTLFSVCGLIKSTSMLLVLAIPSAIVWFYSGSFTLAALLCSVIAVIGAGAFVINALRSWWISFIVPMIYLIALLFSRDPIMALFSLSCLPAAIVLAFSYSRRRGLVSTVCRVSATGLVTAAVLFLIYAITRLGFVLSYEGIVEASDRAFDAMLRYYSALYERQAEIYKAAGISPMVYEVTPYDAKEYTVALFGMLPAFAMMATNGIAFVAHKVTNSLTLVCEIEPVLSIRRRSVFSMSWMSAVVYIVAYFVMTIASYGNNNTLQLVAENVYMLLLPGLIFVGILVLLGRGVSRRRHIFTLALLVMVSFSSLNLALSVTAFIGCAEIIRSNLKKLFGRNVAK